MPRTVPDEKITRIGGIAKDGIEFFKVALTLLPTQRKALRANKGKYLWKLFERHSHEVNNFYVTTTFVEKVDKLLDKTPAGQNIPLNFIVWHVAASGTIMPRSSYI